MRYIGIVLVLASLPAFIIWLRGNPTHRRFAYFFVGLFPFTLGALNLDASLWNVGGLGYAQGVVVTLLDTLCLAILATMRHNILRLPFIAVFSAYTAAVLISIIPAEGFWAPFSYAFQLFRMFLVFVTVATIIQQPGMLRFIAYGLALGASVQGVITVFQRLGGTFQAGGTIGHQNLTGMVLHFSTLPLLAMLLAGNKSKLYMAGVAGGLVAVALGASRGSIGFLGLGLALLLVLSIVRRATPRKFGIAGLSVLMVAAAAPVIIGGLQERLQGIAQNSTGYDERAAFEKAAAMMFADNPMGVGANRYTFVANVQGYSERAGVAWAEGSRTAVVHNLYYLTAAELGWLGLFTLILLLVWVIFKGFQFSFTNRRDPRGDVVLGCTCAVSAMALQSLFEWVFVLTTLQYVFAITLGIISGSIMQRKNEQARARREAKLARRGVENQAPALVTAANLSQFGW